MKDTQPIADLMDENINKLKTLLPKPNKMRNISIKIVNMINENFSLKLFTVDSAQMTDEIKELLESELPKPTKKAINKAVISALEDVLKDMEGVHPEYHKESVTDELSYLKTL